MSIRAVTPISIGEYDDNWVVSGYKVTAGSAPFLKNVFGATKKPAMSAFHLCR